MTTTDQATFYRALIAADPRLSRFNPLSRILAYDDFDEGANGWCELIGNHDGNLDNVSTLLADFRPPQISSCSFFDIGTHGSVDGTYALKVATRACPNSTACAIKRLTYAATGRVQFEAYFTYKAEASLGGPHPVSRGGRAWDGNYHPSEALFGDLTIGCDVSGGPEARRFHCALRYANTDVEGNFIQHWQYKTSLHPTTKMQRATPGVTPGTAAGGNWHTLDPRDWLPIPNGAQRLCFNEVPTKINWHYLRWVFDTAERRNVELQINDLTLDLSDVPVPVYNHRYDALNTLLNLYVDVRTHVPVRNFLYLDSALISVDW
jgi:hypothetical protein